MMPEKSPRAGTWAAHHTADCVAVRAEVRAAHPDDERPGTH